ncbi:transglycosylase domain-containing protein [Actinomyces polynesiensis]|uniref:transglycosylase domain-containing protein n=1 Tax=Actinomyces polynesiensis TaxID=1325934 RepID=UPI00093C82D3|nr:transglycosylase domain-containing protein [Actinomyces polynesiensis]
MSSPRSRSVTPVQLVALLLAFLSVAGLTGVLAAGLLVPAAGSLGVVAKTVPSVFEDLPADLQIVEPAEESVMLDASNNVIARFYDKRRIVVGSDQIADVMEKAIVGVEDKRFYQHHGIDPEGMARALVNNLSDDSGTQGASTITQQYVRNMLVEKGQMDGDPDEVIAATEKTKERKLREAKYAMALETEMSKDQILTGYLNIVPFGPTTYGVEAASRLYFSKSANDLTMSEAILLAGLVQSPVQYDPLVHPDAAQDRRDTVAGVLLKEGTISQDEYDEIVGTSVESMLKPDQRSQGCAGAGNMAYFCEYALQEFLDDKTYGDTETDRLRLLDTGGLTIRTTIDTSKQKAAAATLASANPTSTTSGTVNAVLTSVDPGTGDVLSMAQNTAYGTEGKAGTTTYNFAANGTFQVGSTFKLFTLMEWFKEGHSAYDTVGRANRNYYQNEFSCSNGHRVLFTPNPYEVEDLPGKDGTMNVIRATGLSVNQAFINMATKLDFCAIFQTAADMGITQADGSVIEAAAANIIGSGSTSPLQMASVAATLANDGVQCTPHSLAKVTDRDENVLKEYKPSCKKVLDSTVAQQVTTLLNKSVQQYYIPSEGITLADNRPYAAKTGTTNDNSNTWTVGFTPSLATAAWMGNGAASSTKIENVTVGGQTYPYPYGSTVGMHIWAPYMSAALAGTPVDALPDVFIGNQPVSTPTPDPTSTQQGNTDQGNDGNNGQNGDKDNDQGDNG